MAKAKKEKKKTPIPEGTMYQELGIYYYEDIPEYHKDGVECTEEEWERHVVLADSLTQGWLKSKIFKEKIKERTKDERKNQT